MENGHVTEIVSLMEGEWSCYTGGQVEREWACYRGGQFNGGSIVLPRLSVLWRENGHVTEVANLMEGEWLCYGGSRFNGGRMVMLRRWSLMEGAWSC